MIIAVNFPNLEALRKKKAEKKYKKKNQTMASRWSPEFFSRFLTSFQQLKLEQLLLWSFFTFIYNRSTHMKYFIYTSRQS